MKKKLCHLLLIASLAAALFPALSVHTGAAPVTYEAEDGVLSGVTAATATAGYSGTGYVTGFDSETDSVTITVNAPATALYELTVRYHSPFGDKNTSLVLNGMPAGELTLKGSVGFADASGGKILLNAGSNTIGIVNNWGWYEIDAITIEEAPSPPPHMIGKSLVTRKSMKETEALYAFLRAEYGNHILSGQQNLADAEWVYANIGKKPAVLGLDMMGYSPSRVEYGTASTEIENALKWDEQGGIVTFAWHWNAPKGLIDQPGKEWWRGFYTDATTFDVRYAMDNPQSEDYQLLVRDIDAIAVQLKRLEKAKVPVLWRPLHEAEGGWFWWGAKGPEPAKKLYRLMYDRLTNHHKLGNLIWVWNSEKPEWYPGDDVVDIISVDSYPQARDYSPISNRYDNLKALVQDRKMAALTENGPIPDPDLLQVYHAHWSWFVTWGGQFINDGIQNSREHLTKVYNHPYVLTLDELPDWKKYKNK
ncbi:glycosyl hydrolase [Paenibacillus spongiae]|uniref:Beta-mannanase n=1 Tax=Paenibacillus spongiae TaxID=2909671 RepID=A0ABY5S7S9_9BACL|nr:glycosyl hydrolase [Paenibacillus spongiae]UVI29764.1 hypothetical protein L1F29_30885 [Paenibacillus spongiae]